MFAKFVEVGAAAAAAGVAAAGGLEFGDGENRLPTNSLHHNYSVSLYLRLCYVCVFGCVGMCGYVCFCVLV